ncbi:NB-ARC domain-containing protein [Streptomyces sedi]|uniref:NB-ARC domain-containing protein n=1 Tax=Streptomyces sedi TaxID=555059 RepID=UPI001FE33056|nr:NB-ARC domain-containing protein [Streptomyces sedi]
MRNDLSGVVNGPAFQVGQIHGGVTFQVREEPRAPGVRPDQVPSFSGRFRNRRTETGRLNELLDERRDEGASPRPVVLRALPGMGKTALACHWARSVGDAFPDGQIFVDFARLRDGLGADVSEALAMCLRALGVADAYMPHTLAERANELRSRTAGKRLLILLDDVQQPAHVRALLPRDAGSLLLVTSNQDMEELALDGAELLALEPLDAEVGVQLLSDFSGRPVPEGERDAAVRLVELGAGMPVALRVLGARLRRNRRLTWGALAAELEDENQRLAGLSDGRGNSVSVVLATAYRELAPEQAHAYRVLGWLPTRTFDGGTAAAALGTNAEEALGLLDALTRAGLLNVTEEGRYGFHDLVRLHARERAEAEEPEGARRVLVERVTTHFLALTAFADRAIRADRLRIARLTELLDASVDPFTGPSAPPPLAWLVAERDTVLAVLREANRAGLHAWVWPLAEAFTALFLHRRDVRAWRETLLLGADSAAEAGEVAAEARLRSLLSRPLLDLDEDERARTELERAERCAELSGHTVLRASVAEFFGRYWDRHEPPRAIDAYRRSLTLNEEAGEERGAAIAAFFLGCAQDAAGEHLAAQATLERAHAELLALDDLRMAARAEAAIGAVHGHLGDDALAVAVLRRAADALRAAEAGHYEAETLVRLARLVERTGGDQATVREYVARAAGLWEETGHPEAGRLARWRDRLDGGGVNG